VPLRGSSRTRPSSGRCPGASHQRTSLIPTRGLLLRSSAQPRSLSGDGWGRGDGGSHRERVEDFDVAASLPN
jgi:hypothetical protein